MPRCRSFQIAGSDERCAQLSSCVEQHFVDRVAIGSKLCDQGIERYAVDGDCNKNLALPLGQYLVHGSAQGCCQFMPLGFSGWVQPEAVWQPVPISRVQAYAWVAPEVAADPRGHLGHYKLVRTWGNCGSHSERLLRKTYARHLKKCVVGRGRSCPFTNVSTFSL